MRLTWAAATDPGARRPTNEDSYCARPDLGLFLVADGMGGHVAGEIASRLAVETVEGFVAETANPDRSRTWPIPYEPELSLDANRLKAAFHLANRRIAEEAAGQLTLRGMATTASAVLVGEARVIVAHVGDSRVYRLRRDALAQLTRDHSWVEEQVRAGVLSTAAARQHPWRNVVTRALSGGAAPAVDILDETMEAGDRLLICSDGLFAVVSDEDIAATLGGTGSLEASCRALISQANAAGGPDNVTILALEFHAA